MRCRHFISRGSREPENLGKKVEKGPFHTDASEKRNPLAQQGTSLLIPAGQGDDRSVSSPLCRAGTAPLSPMGQSDRNRLAVRFHSIHQEDGGIGLFGGPDQMGWWQISVDVSAEISFSIEETGGSKQVHLNN